MLRKTIAFGATIILSAGLASVPASASTAKTSAVAMTARTSASSSVAAVAKARSLATWKAKARAAAKHPKPNGYCSKLTTVKKIYKYQYICSKNAKHKKAWTKLSPECVSLHNAYLKMDSDYSSAVKQITDMQAKVAGIQGTAGDNLRAQVAGLKSTVEILGPTVTGSLEDFNSLCG
ncbi:MAG TPA: hypothetical protein VMV52_00490 [Candidatus Nanopelagicaceae bacterium]|nr:hypothetical protein [Candidatus Nanopelagicaceae bacterium]